MDLDLQNVLKFDDLFFDPEETSWEDNDAGSSGSNHCPDPTPSLFSLSPVHSSPQITTPPRHSFTFMPSPSPSVSPTLAPVRRVTFRLPSSEVSDSEPDNEGSTVESEQSPVHHSSPPWEGDLPFPTQIFTPDVICIRQFRLVVSPPRAHEDAIFDLNHRFGSPTSDEMSDN
jgi:hypothetical protein